MSRAALRWLEDGESVDAGVPLLVVGSSALRDAVARVLPQARVTSAEQPVDAIWRAGQDRFERVLIALLPSPKLTAAVEAIRSRAPSAKIVIICQPSGEPDARAALDQGVDDYVLEPLSRAELEAALDLPPYRPAAAVLPATPREPFDEYARFGEILRQLADGAGPTLERLARLVQDACDSEGVQIELDGFAARLGDVGDPVLEEPIRRDELAVGRILLGRRRGGAHAASTALRLAEYARLVEVTIAQAREREHWRDLAYTDDLSGLRNRRYFERAVDEHIRRATQQRERLTVLIFDIDDFKSYNDRYGHQTGDELIREVSQLLRRCCREGDLVARLGGDEFAVVFVDSEKPRVPGSQHPAEPIALAERFQRALSEHAFPILGPDRPGPVTISGGLACFPWDGITRDALVAAADAALLEAKRTGKNRIQIAGEHVDAPASAPSE
ncbi:MAG: GGDEF domain-containing response regulator [Phycisphaerae bacterium]